MHKEFNVAPLSGAFMITSIVGFIISAFYVLPNSKTWGFTFVLFFSLMFIASLISMSCPERSQKTGRHQLVIFVTNEI